MKKVKKVDYNVKKPFTNDVSVQRIEDIISNSDFGEPQTPKKSHTIIVRDYKNSSSKAMSLFNNGGYTFKEIIETLRFILCVKKDNYFIDIREGTRQLGNKLGFTHFVTISDVDARVSKTIGIDFGKHIDCSIIIEKLRELLTKNIIVYNKNAVKIIKVKQNG